MRRAERHRGEITRRYGCGTVLYRPAAGLDKSKRGYTFVSGKMAEWSIAAVLKTVELQGSGGSNPSLSAECMKNRQQEGLSQPLLSYSGVGVAYCVPSYL